MNDLRSYTCCFVGHRTIQETNDLKLNLYKKLEKLISDDKVYIFLFGSKSQFDTLCYKIVTDLKNKYPYVKRIYVRAEYPYIDSSYKEYLLERYEDTYYPEKIINAGKFSYVERNYEMINNSSFCICYYDKNYVPQKCKRKKQELFNYQPKSGTKIAFEYALKKKLTVYNFFPQN